MTNRKIRSAILAGVSVLLILAFTTQSAQANPARRIQGVKLHWTHFLRRHC
jgi:hypothetical protein